MKADSKVYKVYKESERGVWKKRAGRFLVQCVIAPLCRSIIKEQ